MLLVTLGEPRQKLEVKQASYCLTNTKKPDFQTHSGCRFLLAEKGDIPLLLNSRGRCQVGHVVAGEEKKSQ